jgi:hypothetical protein
MTTQLPIRLPVDCWTLILSFIVCDRKGNKRIGDKKSAINRTTYPNAKYAVWALGLKHIDLAYKNAIINECQKKIGRFGFPRDFKLSYCLLQSGNLGKHTGCWPISAMQRAVELNCDDMLLEQFIQNASYQPNDVGHPNDYVLFDNTDKRLVFWEKIIQITITSNRPKTFDMICCYFATTPHNDNEFSLPTTYMLFSDLAYQLAFDGNTKMLDSIYRFSFPSDTSDDGVHFMNKIVDGFVDGKHTILFEQMIAQILSTGYRKRIIDVLSDILWTLIRSENSTEEQIRLLIGNGATIDWILFDNIGQLGDRPKIFQLAIDQIDFKYISEDSKRDLMSSWFRQKSFQIVQIVLDKIPSLNLKNEKDAMIFACKTAVFCENNAMLKEIKKREIFTENDWCAVLMGVLSEIQIIILDGFVISWKSMFIPDDYKSSSSIGNNTRAIIRQLVNYTGTEFKKGNELWQKCADHLWKQYSDHENALQRDHGIELDPTDRQRCTHGFMNRFRKTFFGGKKTN